MRDIRTTLLCTTAAVGLASAASAADLAVRKAPPRVAAVAPVGATWTGCFVGGHVGYGWGRKRASDPLEFFTPPEVSIDTDGFLGGVQAGCDYQVSSNWVIGIEGTFSWSDLNGSSDRRPFEPFVSGKSTPTFLSASVKTEWLATIVGRLGYTQGPWMLYGVGGLAWARDKYSVSGLFVDCSEGCFDVAFNAGGNETRTGYVLGVGIASLSLFGGNLSGHLEYNFMDFGTKRVALSGTSTIGGTTFTESFAADIDQQVHLIKAGLNYRFGGPFGPVVARY